MLIPPWSQDAALLYVRSLFTAMFTAILLIATAERTVRYG